MLRFFYSYCRIAFLCFVSSLFTVSCITEDVEPDTARGNFESLWHMLDEHYCFFKEKAESYGVDWNAVYTEYADRIHDDMNEYQLFDVLADMTYTLRDGHVNLYAPHNTARYGAWYDDYPANYADTLERIYLGRAEDYHYTSGLKYRILDDNVGYVRCASFENGFGSGNLNEMIRVLSLCDGLIVDVRNNGGGKLTAAQKLASLFFNSKVTVGYMCHKQGPGHEDFSSPQAVTIEPFEGLRWQKPVVVLTNRRTYSAANAFVSYLKGTENVILIGDKTGGGGGLPFQSELPNGWAVRFSACPMYDAQMRSIEEGIEPDVKTDLTDEDVAKGRDTIIETARRCVRTSFQCANETSKKQENSNQ